jgi:hypothetical protein
VKEADQFFLVYDGLIEEGWSLLQFFKILGVSGPGHVHWNLVALLDAVDSITGVASRLTDGGSISRPCRSGGSS